MGCQISTPKDSVNEAESLTQEMKSLRKEKRTN